jgi:hypothetical protein
MSAEARPEEHDVGDHGDGRGQDEGPAEDADATGRQLQQECVHDGHRVAVGLVGWGPQRLERLEHEADRWAEATAVWLQVPPSRTMRYSRT